MWVVVVGLGFLITGPLDNLPGEKGVNDWFVSIRTPTMNDVTAVICQIGNTPIVVAIAVVVMLLLLWRTRQWWFALVPGLAIGLQAAVFLTSSLVVGRERPDVDHLDDAPPTSSYPSGHTGASTALYVSLALVAQRIENRPLRVVVTVLLLLAPARDGLGPALPRDALADRRARRARQRHRVRVHRVELPAPGHLGARDAASARRRAGGGSLRQVSSPRPTPRPGCR